MGDSVARVSGVIVPMVTPFREDYSLDLEAASWLAKYLSNTGVSAIFPNSTTGEFPHLTMEEAVELVKAVIDSVPSSRIVMPGISANTTLHSIELAKRFRDLGVEYVISTTPYYFKPSPQSLYRHFAEIASRVDVNVVLYCIPSTTGVLIPPNVVRELAIEFSNIVGIKITHDSMSYVRRVLDEVKGVRKDFSVLLGIDTLLLHGLMEGCDGGVVGLANVAPWIHLDVVRKWFEGDLRGALESHRKLCKLYRVYSVDKPVPSVVKAALEALGTPVRRVVRPPLDPVSDTEMNFIRRLLKELNIVDEAKKFMPST